MLKFFKKPLKIANFYYFLENKEMALTIYYNYYKLKREEKMRVSSRAIIIENGKLLTMFRRKFYEGKWKEYYVIPGGGLEEGETLEENVVRELKEEMNVDIRVLKFIGNQQFENREDNYFLCEIIAGTPKLGGEELERMTNENYYEPRYIEIDKLEEYDIQGKELILKANRLKRNL